MNVKPPSSEFKTQWREPATEYRVTLWEQPVMESVPVDRIGWGEVTYDLDGVTSVQEAIEWAERLLTSGKGPYSCSGTPVRDREFVLFAKVPGEDKFLQLAGWDPTVNAPAAPPYNLPRQRRTRSP
ncbi:MAG TPA: hypothetical protein VJT84_14195 [Gaiellaceae bacterium]|nr:hypothetical protein [Gaiellaceae bacterium]